MLEQAEILGALRDLLETSKKMKYQHEHTGRIGSKPPPYVDWLQCATDFQRAEQRALLAWGMGMSASGDDPTAPTQGADARPVAMTNGSFHCPACGETMKGPLACGHCLWQKPEAVDAEIGADGIATRNTTPRVDARPVAITGEPVLWWNGFRKDDDERDGLSGLSFSPTENTWHDIPLYAGVNPCNLATRDATPSDPWISAPEALPTKPGNYLAMMADENSFGYTSDEPVLVEFDAYTDHPGQFTISDSWTNGPETATDEVEFWMPLPARPVKASAPREKT